MGRNSAGSRLLAFHRRHGIGGYHRHAHAPVAASAPTSACTAPPRARRDAGKPDPLAHFVLRLGAVAMCGCFAWIVLQFVALVARNNGWSFPSIPGVER